MHTILTCTDGSIYAPSIYQHAAWAAARLDASVDVLHVIEHHREYAATVDLSGAIGFDASAELTQELTKLEEAEGRVALLKGKAILETARQELASLGVHNATFKQRHGTLLETLVELEPHAELVVVGKRGEHAGATQSPLGHNLEELVRISVRPVLVAARAFRKIQKFLIAFDNSPSVRHAISYLTASPLLKGLHCHLLMVGREDRPHTSALQEAKKLLTTAGFQVTAELLPGNPTAIISDRIKTANIDLLVMGAYGHSQIREFFVGSTTTKLVRTCSVPVLMFRS